MTFHIITIFPRIFDSYFNESIIKRAQAGGQAKIKIYNLRDWTTDRHKTVDDVPYGGGAGMVMKIEPLYKALKDITTPQIRGARGVKNQKIILLSAKGKRWTQQLAQKHSKLEDMVLICGRYEGVDERISKLIDEEISIGDYVLTGGEIGALAIVDSITRLIPGVLGNRESLKDESHTEPGVLEYPQYTRPEVFEIEGKKYRVPKVLLSGDHKKIEDWRKSKMKRIKK